MVGGGEIGVVYFLWFWIFIYKWGKRLFIIILLILFGIIVLFLGSRNNNVCGYVVFSMVLLK